MSAYELWQQERFGNILPPYPWPEPDEEEEPGKVGFSQQAYQEVQLMMVEVYETKNSFYE